MFNVSINTSLRWFQNVIWLWLSLPWFYSGSRRTRTNYTEIGSQSSQLTHTQSVRLRPVDLLLRIFRHSCDSVTLLRISGTRQFSKCVETIKYIYFLGQIVKATVSLSRWICLSVLVNAVSPSWHGFYVSSPFRRSASLLLHGGAIALLFQVGAEASSLFQPGAE